MENWIGKLELVSITFLLVLISILLSTTANDRAKKGEKVTLGW